MQFSKYHALGNDYLVVEGQEARDKLNASHVVQICAPHFGMGADGILVREADLAKNRFRIRILNPDGSEAEKSGNGLRIFARYLWDQKAVGEEAFEVVTSGGLVTCLVSENGRTVSVDMGRITFHSHDIPVIGRPRDVLDESLSVNGRKFNFSAASIGNPHCVIVQDTISPEETRTWGPLIETESCFPNLTNVQFLKILDRRNIQIEIWERGAGYTLASGTSSCAAAAVAHKLNLCDAHVTVHMPGGKLIIELSDDFAVRMTGPVVKVADGRLCEELFKDGQRLANAGFREAETTDRS